MANTAQRLTGLNLDAYEVKHLTRLPDAWVEDYLSFQRNILELASAIDEGEENSNELSRAVANSILDVPLMPEKYLPDTEAISADYETAGDHRLACINDAGTITVTLNDTPDDLEKVSITRTRSRVVLDGNGKTINGESTITLARQYVSLQVEYILDTDEWVIS